VAGSGDGATGAGEAIGSTAPKAVGGRPSRSGGRRGSGPGGRPSVPSQIEITSVAVLPAGDEPGDPLVDLGPGADGADGAEDGTGEGTASDWLPGIRDEHDDDGGWQARWLDRPTWDRTVTPNVIKRTGSRPSRRRR
jgi:hypothetical protein